MGTATVLPAAVGLRHGMTELSVGTLTLTVSPTSAELPDSTDTHDSCVPFHL